jgi:glutamate/aspartate transport system ATP-binding protein
MIKITNVSKHYGDFQVLTDCTTSVSKGEVIVVCGPSGSGKSTLIKCVNGLEPFQSRRDHRQWHLGRRPEDQPLQAARAVGMVFQNFELFPHMSITENLTIAQVKVLGRSKDEAMDKGLKLLDRVGLKRPGQQVSRPALRRPAAARGDRPGAGHGPDLHAVRRADLGARSGDGQRSARRDDRTGPGRHDHDVRHARNGLCQAVADRVIFMDQGRIVEDDSKEAFFANPRSERAQQFLAKILHH